MYGIKSSGLKILGEWKLEIVMVVTMKFIIFLGVAGMA
jgi:hypothetical protein